MSCLMIVGLVAAALFIDWSTLFIVFVMIVGVGAPLHLSFAVWPGGAASLYSKPVVRLRIGRLSPTCGVAVWTNSSVVGRMPLPSG